MLHSMLCLDDGVDNVGSHVLDELEGGVSEQRVEGLLRLRSRPGELDRLLWRRRRRRRAGDRAWLGLGFGFGFELGLGLGLGLG